jgi:hypothetical protein
MTEEVSVQEREVRFGRALLELRAEDGWENSKGAHWISADSLDVRAMASFMMEQGARFMALTATENEDETRLDYHWDLRGTILAFSTTTHQGRCVSFADLCPGVDWAERETYEYFAVEFTGRDNNKPLMLRPGLEAGLNRRRGKKS